MTSRSSSRWCRVPVQLSTAKFPGCCTCTAIDVLELLENFHGKHQIALLKQNLNTWHVHAFKSHLDLLRRELLTSAKALRRLLCSGQHMSAQFTNSVKPHSWDRYINCRTATPKTVLPQATWKLMKLWTDAPQWAGNGPGSAQASTLSLLWKANWWRLCPMNVQNVRYVRRIGWGNQHVYVLNLQPLHPNY